MPLQTGDYILLCKRGARGVSSQGRWLCAIHASQERKSPWEPSWTGKGGDGWKPGAHHQEWGLKRTLTKHLMLRPKVLAVIQILDKQTLFLQYSYVMCSCYILKNTCKHFLSFKGFDCWINQMYSKNWYLQCWPLFFRTTAVHSGMLDISIWAKFLLYLPFLLYLWSDLITICNFLLVHVFLEDRGSQAPDGIKICGVSWRFIQI